MRVLIEIVVMAVLASGRFEMARVVESGLNDRPNYRIPSVVRTRDGDLLVFCEQRKLGIGDYGDTDIVMFRSGDGGRTWSDERVLVDDGFYAHADPTPFVHPATGEVWLFFLYDKKRVTLMRSGDAGRTWSRPASIHEQVIPEAWDRLAGGTHFMPSEPPAGARKGPHWEAGFAQRYGIGPGGVVRLSEGPHAGRVIVPARARVVEGEGGKSRPRSFVFFSDDDGRTWRRGGTVPLVCGEAQLVELAGGRVMVNARDSDASHRPDRIRRQVAVSEDGGATWPRAWMDEHLLTPQCHGSIARYAREERDVLLFVNPRSGVRDEKHPYGRRNLSVQVSADEGATWPVARTIYAEVSAYSDIVLLDDGTIGVVFECGDAGTTHYWTRLMFARFDVDWVMGEER